MGPYFAFFIGTWAYLRHYLNIRIILSLLPLPLPSLTRWLISLLPLALEKSIYASPMLSKITEPIFPDWTSTFATVGSFELDWERQQYKCWISQFSSFALLAALQSLNLFWMYLIVKVAIRFIRTGEGSDDRSEYEGSDDEEDVQEGDGSEKPLLEQKLETAFHGTSSLPHSDAELGDEKTKRRSPRKSAFKS